MAGENNPNNAEVMPWLKKNYVWILLFLALILCAILAIRNLQMVNKYNYVVEIAKKCAERMKTCVCDVIV